MRDTSLWHPFSDMATVRHDELVLVRGEGVYVWDDAGNRYLDGCASLWYCNVGHGRAEIAEAVAEQLRTLETWSTFGEAANPPALELAERLAAHAPADGAKVFFTTGGGDAIDTAAKLARLYWQTIGDPGRLHIISRQHGYHGTMAFGTSIGGMEAIRAGYGPLVPNTSQVPHDSAHALRDEIERLGADKVAAFFCEPVIGAGGVYPPLPGYLEEVAEICAETGVLLVIDSVIVGFGRIGGWYGCERFGIRPDLITFAKGVTSGYLPLGGVVACARIAEPFWSEPGRVMVRHGQTYAGHAAVCAGALANLAILEREGLLSRGQELEGELLEALEPLREHPAVADVRGGVGLIGAVELADPSAVGQLYRAVRSRGVLLRQQAKALAISPPLIATSEHISEIADALAGALDEIDSAGAAVSSTQTEPGQSPVS